MYCILLVPGAAVTKPPPPFVESESVIFTWLSQCLNLHSYHSPNFKFLKVFLRKTLKIQILDSQSRQKIVAVVRQINRFSYSYSYAIYSAHGYKCSGREVCIMYEVFIVNFRVIILHFTGRSRHNATAASHILWQVISQSFSFFKST